MPYTAERYFYHARIGIWIVEESEASLRAGIDVSSATMAKINASKSRRRRTEILASRRLMHRMGISDHSVYYSPEGKPLLRGDDRYISISHSKSRVCVATSDFPIGIDIQRIEHRVRHVLNWFLHPKEKHEKRSKETSLLRHTILWSAKEALYKVEGDKGLSMRDFQVRLPKEILSEGYFPAILDKKGRKKEAYRLYYSHDEKYVIVHAIKVKTLPY